MGFVGCGTILGRDMGEGEEPVRGMNPSRRFP